MKIENERMRNGLAVVLFLVVIMTAITATGGVARAAGGKWKKVDGKKTYFLANGKKAKGLVKVKSGSKTNLYYFKKGIPQKGWKKVGAKKYYFDPKTKKAVVGLKKIGAKTYVFTAKWSLAGTGVVKIGKKAYYAKKGILKTGFVTREGKTYYSTKKGLAVGLKKINGSYYWFDKKTFVMAKDAKVNGRTFGPDGKEVVAASAQKQVTERDETPASIRASAIPGYLKISKFAETNENWFLVVAVYADGSYARVTDFEVVDEQVDTKVEMSEVETANGVETVNVETGKRVFTISYKGLTTTVAVDVYPIRWVEDGSYTEDAPNRYVPL